MYQPAARTHTRYTFIPTTRARPGTPLSHRREGFCIVLCAFSSHRASFAGSSEKAGASIQPTAPRRGVPKAKRVILFHCFRRRLLALAAGAVVRAVTLSRQSGRSPEAQTLSASGSASGSRKKQLARPGEREKVFRSKSKKGRWRWKRGLRFRFCLFLAFAVPPGGRDRDEEEEGLSREQDWFVWLSQSDGWCGAKRLARRGWRFGT